MNQPAKASAKPTAAPMPAAASEPTITATVTPDQAVQPHAFDYEVFAQQQLHNYTNAEKGTIDYRGFNERVYRSANTGEAMPITMPTLAESTAYAKAVAKQNGEAFDEAAHKRQYAATLKGYQQYQRGQFNSRHTALYQTDNVYNKLRYGKDFQGTPENEDRTRQHLGQGIDTRSGGDLSDERDEATVKRQGLKSEEFNSGSYVKLGSDKNYAKQNFEQDGELVQQNADGTGLEKIKTAHREGDDFFNQAANNTHLYRTTVDEEGKYRIERQRPGQDPYTFQGAEAFGSFLGSDTLSDEYTDSDLAGIPRALAQLPQTVGSGLGQSIAYLERKAGQGLQNIGAAQPGQALQAHARQTYARALSIAPTLNRDQQGSTFSSLPGLTSSLSQGLGSYVQIALTGGVGTTGFVAKSAQYLAPVGMALMTTGAAEQGYAQAKQGGYTDNEADLFGAAMGVATMASEKLFNTRMLQSLMGTVAGKQLTQSLLRGEEATMLSALRAEGKTLGRQLTTQEAAEVVQRKFLPAAAARIADKVSAWKSAYEAAGGYEGMVLEKLPKALRPALEFGEAFEEGGEQLLNDAAQNLYSDFVFDGQVYKVLDFLPEKFRPQVEERSAQAREQMDSGTSPMAHKSFEQIMAGAWQSATGGYVTGAALSTLQHFRAAQQAEREQVQSDAIAKELVRTGGKGAEKLLASIDRMEKAGQFGVGLKADGQVPEKGEPTINNLIAQSLRNKVRSYQGLYQQLGLKAALQQAGGPENEQAASEALRLLSTQGNAQELALAGLRTGVAVDNQRQVVENLVSGRMPVNAEGRIASSVSPADSEDTDSIPAGAQAGATVQDDQGQVGDSQVGHSLDLLEFTSSEAYQQSFAQRQALLKSNVLAAQQQGDKPAEEKGSAELQQLEQEAARAKDNGVVGALTKHRVTGAYYEAQQQVRELQQQLASASTQVDELALQQQLSQAQLVAAELKSKAQQEALDNPAAQRMLQLADAQLHLEELQQRRQQVFTGELLAQHVVEQTITRQVAQLTEQALITPTLQPLLSALTGALNQLGPQALSQLQTLTRWQQQYQRDAPAALAEQQNQQQQQSRQASEQLVSLTQQLPAASLHEVASIQAATPLIAQLADVARQATSLVLSTPEAKQHLVDVLTQETERLRTQTQDALPPEQLAAAVEQQVPGGATRLAELEAAVANRPAEDDPELVSALQEEQQALAEQLDDARQSARREYQHPLVQQLTQAASAVAALPLQDTASLTTLRPDQLAADFYTGRHTGLSEPGELAKQAGEWAAATPAELATRRESALAALEEQAQLNNLHLQLRRTLGEQLHQPGVLPSGVASKYLAPISEAEYQAAKEALQQVDQDLQTARAKFSQASGSRFDEDNKLDVQHRQRQAVSLAQLADLAGSSTRPALQALRPALLAFGQRLAAQQVDLATGTPVLVASLLTQAEEDLRGIFTTSPQLWGELANELLQRLSLPAAHWQASEANTERGKFAESNLYQGSPYAGLFTYLNTLAGLSPAQWAGAYQRIAQQLAGSNPAAPGKLPSLEQQAVIRDINGFLLGKQNVAFAAGSQLAADEAHQLQNPASKFMAGSQVLYVPGAAGTGKTKLVIRTALLTQAELLGRSEATPYRVLASAPYPRQQQTLAQQLSGQARLAVQNVEVEELIKQLTSGTIAADVAVLDEGTIFSDEQAQALLKAHAAYNATQTVPVRLVVLGDPAQMSGRDLQGNRSDKQFFVNPTQRFVLSTRPLTQVYRTGLVPAFQLFDALRGRILSGGFGPGNQTRNLSPVPGMRFSQAGTDLTTLEGIQYLTADAQRQQAAALIISLQQRQDPRTVAYITSRQLVESETRELRRLGVTDAGKYVLAGEDLTDGQHSIVHEIDQSQGGEFDFVFVAVQEENRGDALGTPTPDAANTLRALNVGATRMTRYAALRYEPATNNYELYQNQQVARLEKLEPESVEATVQRNATKQELLQAQASVQVSVQAKAAPAAATPTEEAVGADESEAVALTQEQRQRKQELEQLRDSLGETAVGEILAGPRELSWTNVQLAQQEAAKLEQLAAQAKELSQQQDYKQPELAELLVNLREAYRRHSAAQQQLVAQLTDVRQQLLTIPADVAPTPPTSQEADALAGHGHGAVALVLTDPATGASQVVVTMPAGSQGVAQAPVDCSLAPLLELDEQGILDLHKAHGAILTGSQLVREQRARQPVLPVPAEKVGGLVGPSVLPTDVVDKTQLALAGRVVLQHFGGVEESEGRQNPRALQANQALQAKIAQVLIPQSVENPRRPGERLSGYGTLDADHLAGLPLPSGEGTFQGSAGGGEFFITWHPTRSAYGQGGGEQYKQNTFSIEYAEGTNRIGVALVYKDGVVTAEQGTVHQRGTEAPFDQVLTALQRSPSSRRSLGTSLPLERVNHPQFTDFDRQGPASADVSGQFDYATLQKKMGERGLAVSSPWVITATAADNVTLGKKPWAKPGKAGEVDDDQFGSLDTPNTSYLSGRTVVFVQRAGTAQKSPAEVDALIAEAIERYTKLAENPKEENVTASNRGDLIVKELLRETGLEMQLLSAERYPTKLTDYFNALRQQEDAPVPETGEVLQKLLRGTVDLQGKLQTLVKREKMPDWERNVKQMLFSPTQFEFRADQGKPQTERRGLRNKLLGRTLANGQTEPGVLEKAKLIRRNGAGNLEAGTNLSKFVKGQQKRHFLAVVQALQDQSFEITGTDAEKRERVWNAVLGAWPEDLFTYLTYLDQKTQGEVSKAWQQSQGAHPIQVRFYGGATAQPEAQAQVGAKQAPRTTHFSRVQQPAGLPLAERIGGTRLTMQSVSSVLNLERALAQAAPQAAPQAVVAATQPQQAPQETQPVPQPQVQPQAQPATQQEAVGSEPAETARIRGTRRRNSLNPGTILQGDANPAQAEALLRDLFGRKLDFQLNASISFSKELGVMAGNLISLATDSGMASGRVNLTTARHEAIHRVLRIVSPAYRARLLDAAREVLRQDKSQTALTDEQLADDELVEEKLADYYPQVAAYYQAQGEEFKQRKLVKFLQGFGAGRLVLRALQAVYRAAERLKAEPDYLGQLFADMDKGYYRERSVRQRYDEERAYQLNATPTRPGRVSRAQRQQDVDSLEDVLGGLDNVYDWLDRLRNDVYNGMFEFDATRERLSATRAIAAGKNTFGDIYQEILAEYGADNLPSVHDVDPLRAEDAGWLALQTPLQRPGGVDEDGNELVRQTTPLDILLDFAFAHLQGGTATSEQGVDRDAEAAQNNAGDEGSDIKQNSARVAAAQQAAAENTDGIPVWEKERELRQGASLDMHLESTPVYIVQSWSDFIGDDALQGTLGKPILVRDPKRRYLDPKAAQKVLDRTFAGLASDEVATLEGVRSVLHNLIRTETGEAQHTAASLYLKFFNGNPDPITGKGPGYVEVSADVDNQQATPVSFFEVVHPERTGSPEVRGTSQAILDSYAQEYRRTLSELLMHYRSAVNKAAVDVNVLEGLQVTGKLTVPLDKRGSEVRDKHNQQRKTVGVSRLAGTFLRASLDEQGQAVLSTKREPLTAFEQAGFALVPTTHAGTGKTLVQVTYQGQPFLMWGFTEKGNFIHRLDSKLPTMELARAYTAALATAGIDVDAEQLGQVLDDRRSNAAWRTKNAQSVLGYKNSRSLLPELVSEIWSQAYGQHLTETGQQQTPVGSVLTDARLQGGSDVRTDLEQKLGVKPAGSEPILYRSPLSAWKQVDEVLALMSQWQKGGEQSSVRTADGAQKFLRGLGTSAVQRLRTLGVLREQLRAGGATLPEQLATVLDSGLGWAGISNGQPAQWGNYYLTGEVRHEGVLTLNKLTNPLTGKAVDLVKASKSELHSAAVWHFFWKTWTDTGGQRLALFSSPKADKTTQNATVHGRGSGPLVFAHADTTGRTEAALQNLHNSYLAQFYGAVARRWQDAKLPAELRFTPPANWQQLPVRQAMDLLQQHILSRGTAQANATELLRRSPLRDGVDYVVKDGALKGFSPDLRGALQLTPQQYAQQVRAAVEQEARQLIDQGLSAPPVALTKLLRQNPVGEGGYSYDPHFKFRDKDLQGSVPDKLVAADGSPHPLLLDYLLTHRILAQHLDTAMTGHHIYYPKGPVDMVKRGVLDHTAYETPDVSNPRGLPRYSKVLVFDDLKAGDLSADGSHNAQFKALLKGLGMSEAAIAEAVDGQDLQDGLAFMDPLYWRQERESQGMKYPLREQIKNIQGGMSADGTPFVFKNSYLVLSNEMLKLGNERVWNMVAQSLGGYQSELYKTWLGIRAGMDEGQLDREEDWDALHQLYITGQHHGERASGMFVAHAGKLVLASGNKVAPHSIRSSDFSQDPSAHEAAFEVDNLLGGRVLSLYQNPTGASIANITQENHMLAPGGDNYRAMHQIYDLLGQLAYQGLDELQKAVQTAATKSAQLGSEAYFYQKAIDSLTALGNISNVLSLARAGADANVPLVAKQLQGAIASTINSFSVKQRMNGLRATVATMSGLVPMYNVSWTDAQGVVRTERYTQAQVLKRELATRSNGVSGPVTLQWQPGVQAQATTLQFTQLATGAGQPASPGQAQELMRLANEAMQTGNTSALDAAIAAHGYALTGQEVLVPREMASQFGIRAGDDVADVNEAGPAYFLAQHGSDQAKANEAWQNWLVFTGSMKSTRVPVTNMNSTQMSQVVGFLNNHGNTVLVPSEAQTVSGCDNDGDQTTLEALEVRRGGLSPVLGTPAATRQQIFVEKANCFSDVRNINQLVRLLSNSQINNLAKEADKANEAGKIPYGVSRGFHAHASNIDTWHNAHAGKAGVGPMVKVRETFNNLYALAQANPGNAALTQVAVPSYFQGQVYASLTDRVQGVMETLEELANGALDNTKNNTLGPLNMNDHTFGAYGAAAVLGWSLPDMVSVLNHPAVRQVVEKLQRSNSVFTRKSEEVKLLVSMQPTLLNRFGISSQGERENQYTGELTSYDKPQREIQQELVAAITAAHQQQSVAGQELTGELAVEHFYLMAARGEELLQIQRVLSPMGGVDSADYDSENAITSLVETLTGNRPATLDQGVQALTGLLHASAAGGAAFNHGQLVVSPRAVFEANRFAVAGAEAMLRQASALQSSQILRQPATRQGYLGYLREAGGSEARTFKMHGQLTQAFDQMLDARFLNRTGGVAVPVSVLEEQQANPATYAQLWALQQADLQTLAGRHQFVEAASVLLSQVKMQGGSDATFFGGLGQSALVKELKFDQDNQGNFGMLAQLERATELDPAVKNKLEREFNKLVRLNPDYGKLLQDVLVTYQLLTKGLTTGRGSFAEIFGPQALTDYSADRASVKKDALAGATIVRAGQAEQVLVRQPSLLPQVQPRSYAALTDEQQALLEAGEDPGESPLQDDQQYYFAKPEALPATLSNELVQRGLSKRQKQQLKKQASTTGDLVTIRNKVAGLVLYKQQPGSGKWVRQFAVGNPAVNSYELGSAHPVLSSLPVYDAGSASSNEDLSDQNPRVQEYLQQVRSYVQRLSKADQELLLGERGLRVYTKFGQPLDVEVVKVCR